MGASLLAAGLAHAIICVDLCLRSTRNESISLTSRETDYSKADASAGLSRRLSEIVGIGMGYNGSADDGVWSLEWNHAVADVFHCLAIFPTFDIAEVSGAPLLPSSRPFDWFLGLICPHSDAPDLASDESAHSWM